MGPSMSNPQNFKKRNAQRHYQDHLRKYRTQKSQETKIKLRGVSQYGASKRKQTSDHKIMVRQSKQYPQTQPIFKTRVRTDRQDNQSGVNVNNTVKFSLQAKQDPPRIRNIQPLSEYPQPCSKRNKIDEINTQSSGSIKKIILNNQIYSIDVQKMKNRRLKSRERYTNSVFQNAKNVKKYQSSNAKPSKYSNNIAHGVSSLELQSELRLSGQPKHLQAQFLQSTQKDMNPAVNEYYYKDKKHKQHKGKDRNQRELMQAKLQTPLKKVKKSPNTQQIICKNQLMQEYFVQSYKYPKPNQSQQNQIQNYQLPKYSLYDSNGRKSLKFTKVSKV